MILSAVAVGVVALAGCSAGQVTQTDSIEPAVNGNRADIGAVALRDVMIAYPEEAGGYDAGGAAPLVLTIVNTGDAVDELVSVSSPAASSVELAGNPTVPGRSALQVVVPDESEEPVSSQPETTTDEAEASEAPGSETSAPETTETDPAPQELGTMSIVLTGLTADLPTGRNVPVTFVFANAGQVTVNLPIAAPATARPEPTGTEEDEGGH